MTTSTELPATPDGWAFFLDVDGTLIDIAETPDGVVVPPELPKLLADLSARTGGAVALVSGRAIATLDRLVAPARLAAAGVHGAEMRFADGHRENLGGDALADVRPQLVALGRKHPALIIEDKGPAVAVHYRAEPALGPTIQSALADIVSARPALHVQPGKMVFEVRPAGADKGRALGIFMQRPPFAGRRPLAVGDDLTDEHMFAIADQLGGRGVKVGADSDESAAPTRLADPATVRAWLADLVSAPR